MKNKKIVMRNCPSYSFIAYEENVFKKIAFFIRRTGYRKILKENGQSVPPSSYAKLSRIASMTGNLVCIL